jgi:hypothetical protein
MSSSRLVIKSHAPVRKRLLWVAAMVGLAAVGVALYLAGQGRAGFNSIGAEMEIGALNSEIRDHESQNQTLREHIAVLETAAKIDREAYRRVEDELTELQTKILDQQEDIAFYRGIVTPDDTAGLRIQNFSLSRGLGPLTFNMQLVLAQAFRSDRQVAGTVELSVEGVSEGQAVRLGLLELLPQEERKNRLKFSFRYFQDLKADLVLPRGFAPQRVIVKVTPTGKSAKTVEESFDWAVKPG